jgi:hypothetical protein
VGRSWASAASSLWRPRPPAAPEPIERSCRGGGGAMAAPSGETPVRSLG